MRISFTRFSIAPVLALQLIAAIFVISLGHSCGGVFKDFNATLPAITVIALQATRTAVLAPIAAITTATVAAVEVFSHSEVRRLIVQVVALSAWFAFACFCVAALTLVPYTVIEKLR